jgi:hypothetical protein
VWGHRAAARYMDASSRLSSIDRPDPGAETGVGCCVSLSVKLPRKLLGTAGEERRPRAEYPTSTDHPPGGTGGSDRLSTAIPAPQTPICGGAHDAT